MTSKITKKMTPAEQALREHAMSYPLATEDFPWNHRTIKVKGKAFIFMGINDEGFGLSLKLPVTGGVALSLPFCSPTGYGLAKSGWVSAQFKDAKSLPVGLIKQWIDESFRAVAPKTLVKNMDAAKAGGVALEPKAKPRGKKVSAVKKTARKQR